MRAAPALTSSRGGPGGIFDQDTAAYTSSEPGVNIDLNRITQFGGDAEGDELTSIERVIGSRHNDTIVGNVQANVLRGGAGQDTIDAGDNHDTIFADLDNVTDTLIGGLGFDTVTYHEGTRDMTIRLGEGTAAGTAVVNAGPVETTFMGRPVTIFVPEILEDYLFGIEAVLGSRGNDTMIGNSESQPVSSRRRQ